jgi:hypothetical protein
MAFRPGISSEIFSTAPLLDEATTISKPVRRSSNVLIVRT